MGNWLYNGVSLPPLPDSCVGWTTVFMVDGWYGNNGAGYAIYCTDDMYIADLGIGYGWVLNSGILIVLEKSSGTWGAANSITNYAVGNSEPMWTKADLYGTTNGKTQSVILTGSVPIDEETGEKIYKYGNGEITGISIVAPDTISKGFFVSISINVTGTGEFDNSASCVLNGANSANTILDKQGDYNYKLYCDSGETAENITITATSVHDPSFTTSKTITVTGSDSGGDSGGGTGGGDSGGSGGGDSEITPEVTGITVTGIPYSVDPGTSFTIAVTVRGVGDYDNAFIAELGGNTSSQTQLSLSSPNELTCYIGDDEQSNIITIIISSEYDSSRFVSRTVYINHADVPVFKQNLPYPNVFTYELGDDADTYSVEASVSDGGTLTYQWYCVENDVSTLIEGATSTSYTPQIDKLSRRTYHCVVINTTASGLTAYACSTDVHIIVVPSSFKLGIAVGLALKGWCGGYK